VRCRSLALIALMVSATAIALAQSGGSAKPAQAQADQQQPPSTFRTEANFVRVDVYPTKNGTPVQDLKAEDFDVLEDGAPQAIQSFEHIVISPAGPQSQRAEPNSIEESRQLAANPRNRLFVLFLDTPHVSVEGGWHAREPLIRLIDRILGPDDLVGLMTPRMSASDVVFARKTEVIASGLRARWPWGERGTIQEDDREKMYEVCYPPSGGGQISPTATAMIDRRRERATLDSLTELVNYLRDLREERKAIVTVTEGWLLYRPDSRLSDGEPTPVDPISVGPDGRLTTKNMKASSPYSRTDCDADRLQLAMMDDEQYFRDLTDEANRGNASFYTVDPRGLAVFDSAIGPARPPSITADASNLRSRMDSLRGLAGATDGIAVLNNNDLDVGMKRISDDLTSYYLLGYYSTNGKMDGRFHNIKVRVKRPGVDVRARKGYRAATAAEVSAAKAAANAPAPEGLAPVQAAMATLARIRPDARLSLNAVALKPAGAATASTVWVAGELPSGPNTDSPRAGGTVEITVSAAGKSSSAKVTLAPGERSFAVPVALPQGLGAGAQQLDVRARLTGPDSSIDGLSGNTLVDMAGGAAQPMLFRRGPITGNRVVPAASFLFSRTERARFEFPANADAKPGAGRLLDRGGQPLAIPVTVSERTDDKTGQRWVAADVTLAALAAGDYAVEVTLTVPNGTERLLAPVRVGR
jgi:VWFA-related protein